MLREFRVRVPGSCGEFIQGRQDNKPFLITCPIDIYSSVEVRNGRGVTGLGEKSYQAFQLTLKLLGETSFPYAIHLTSQLPRGKGMASSSADIACTAYATARAFDIELSEKNIMEIATTIEPTDGVFLSGIVDMNQISGELAYRWDKVPALSIAIFDTGGEVDTCSLHALRREVEESDFLERTLFYEGMQEKFNFQKIFQSTRASAWCNQKILPKTGLKELNDSLELMGALGYNVAHSGTVMGIFFDGRISDVKLKEKAEKFSACYDGLQFLQIAHLCSGGCIYEEL